MNKDNIWGWITLFLVFALIIGIITHAYGFSLAAGTLFTGLQGLGNTLEAPGIKSGTTRPR